MLNPIPKNMGQKLSLSLSPHPHPNNMLPYLCPENEFPSVKPISDTRIL